jgi:hypothetical protein
MPGSALPLRSVAVIVKLKVLATVGVPGVPTGAAGGWDALVVP